MDLRVIDGRDPEAVPGPAGGVIDQPIHLLAVECLAIAVPDSIRVPVADLQLGQAIHVKELVLPEGVKVLADPDTKKRFADLGVETKSSTPAEFSAFIRQEMDKYAKLIKEANIKVNP